MARKLETMAAVLLAAALVGLGEAAPSSSIDSSRIALNLKIISLDMNFADSIQEVFYEKRDDADQNYPVLALLAEIARIELSQHRRERQALMVADDIYEKYFLSTTGTSSASEWPPRTTGLAELIVSRLVQRACEREMREEQYTRRRIFDIFNMFNIFHISHIFDTYEQSNDIQDIASDYAVRLKDRRSRADAAKTQMERAMDRYAAEVSSMGQFSAAQMSQLLATVDQIINEADSRFNPGRHERSDEDISKDIAATARQAAARIDTQSMGLLDLDSIDRVEEFEDLQAMEHTNNVLIDIDIELSDLEDEFNRTMDELFHDVQAVAAQNGDVPLKAMSARIAECEAILYSSERRMLLVVRDIIDNYFVKKEKELPEPLIDNRNLVDLVWRRAVGHALEGGFQEIAQLRKEIYLMANKYDKSYLVGLARLFYSSLLLRKDELSEDDADSFLHSKKYQSDVAFVMSEAQLSDTMKAVDRLIDEAVAMDYLSELDQTGALREAIGDELLQKIRDAKQVYEEDQEQVRSTDLQDVIAYEDLLLGPQSKP